MGRSVTESNATQSSQIGTEVAQIYSASGYQAGDLIYNLNGAYGLPTATTATFPISATQTGTSGNTNYGLFDVVEGNNAGTLYSNPADLLTNGNTVVVWVQGTFTGRTTSAAYFKIIDNLNNEVVAPTIIATNLLNPTFAQIGVVALTGGGFAVAFRGVGSTLFRAVYSNTGAVVFAATNTTYSLNTNYLTLRMTATTDGKFAVIYVLASTNNWFLDIYNADGSLGSHITLAAAANGNEYSAGIAARNNGGTHEIGFCYASSTTVLRYGVYNTAGTVRLAEAALAPSNLRSTDMCVNTTDNNFVLFYIDASNLFYTRINTTPALVSGATIATNTNYAPVFAKSLSTGGFFVLTGGTSTQERAVPYFIYNGSYTLVSTVPSFIRGISSQNYNGYSATESGGVLTIYNATQGNNEGPGATTYNSFYGMIYRLRVNINTYLQVSANTTYNVTNLAGNTSALPVSGYVRSISTPTSASFISSATSTQSISIPATSGSTGFIVPQTVIETLPADSMDCDTLPNGNIVIVYRLRNTQVIKMAVYTQAGVLVNNTTVATTSSLSADSWQNAYVAALPNGKIVVVYYTTTSSLSYAIYSSTFTLLNSGVLVASLVGWANLRHANIAALSDNRFVVGYNQLSTVQFVYAVYDDTGTLVQGETPDTSVGSTASSTIKIAGTSDGGFAYVFTVPSSAVYANHVTKTGATTYQRTASSATFGADPTIYNASNSIVVGPDNTIYIYHPVDAGNSRLFKVNPTPTAISSPASTSGTNNSGNYASVTITGFGQVVSFNQEASSGSYFVATGTGQTQTTISTSNFTSGARALVCMTGGYDNAAVIALLNTSQQPTFFIINAASTTYSTTITSGVTTSNGTILSPYGTPPYYLTGVSQTAAPAGGVGTVQTNGSAVLNSNYSASTTGQYFDFDTPNTFGVKGSISGRNVTMTRT